MKGNSLRQVHNTKCLHKKIGKYPLSNLTTKVLEEITLKRGWQEKIKFRLKSIKHIQRINKIKSWFFEEIIKIDKLSQMNLKTSKQKRHHQQNSNIISSTEI